MYIIRILGLAGKSRTSPVDCPIGHYVKEYSAKSHNGAGSLVTTIFPDNARTFPDLQSVHNFINQSAGLRPDGKPNKPLTAYHLEVIKQ